MHATISLLGIYLPIPEYENGDNFLIKEIYL